MQVTHACTSLHTQSKNESINNSRCLIIRVNISSELVWLKRISWQTVWMAITQRIEPMWSGWFWSDQHMWWLKMFNVQSETQSSKGPCPTLLTWQVTQKKMPWNIVLLLGGGFALAKGSEVCVYVRERERQEQKDCIYKVKHCSSSRILILRASLHRHLVCPAGSAIRWLHFSLFLPGPSPSSSVSSSQLSPSVPAMLPQRRCFYQFWPHWYLKYCINSNHHKL